MKSLSNTEAELKKGVAYRKACISNTNLTLVSQCILTLNSN